MKTRIKNLCAINFIATRWRMLAVDLTKYTKFRFIMTCFLGVSTTLSQLSSLSSLISLRCCFRVTNLHSFKILESDAII